MIVSSSAPSTAERLIVARLPLQPGKPAQVNAGKQVHQSQAKTTRAYLYGVPCFLDPWLDTTNVATRWRENRQRVLDSLDGVFLLLVVENDNFYLVNDKVSQVTWFWTKKDDQVYASNSLVALMDAAQLPLRFDYRAYRHHIYTRGHHFDMCVVQDVGKMLKGHYVDRSLNEHRYYRLEDNFRHGATPADYFDHVRDVIRQTLMGKKVAVLSSNGFDSRTDCILASQCLDQFEVFTIKADAFSEHRQTRQFLKSLPKQNYKFRVAGHSMSSGSPRYTIRNLYEHAPTFLSCFDDLTENKEHVVFADILATLAKEGFDAIVTGCMGGDVRKLLPMVTIYDRPTDLDQAGTSSKHEFFRDEHDVMKQRYTADFPDAGLLDPMREFAGDGQQNYTAPMLLHHGVLHVPLPICTARAHELYRGIDRTSVPGRGGINFFREFIQEQTPKAPPIPFDNGIAFHQPFENSNWLPQVLDIDFVHNSLLESGVFDQEFLELMRDSYGQQRSPYYSGSMSYLNLWAWYCVVTDQPDAYMRSLEPLRTHDPYLQPPGLSRTLQVTAAQLRYAMGLALFHTLRWDDPRHFVNRQITVLVKATKRLIYQIGSAGYGVLRKCFGLGPWKQRP